MTKLHLSLLSFLVCGMPVYADSSFMAEGVDTSDLANSAQFYDSGKGYYWTDYYSSPGHDLVLQAVSDDSFQSLGDLVKYMPSECQGKLNAGGSYYNVIGGTPSLYSTAIGSLNKDSNLCWAHTSANVIQYWQGYYGMFYKGTQKLVDGLTYDRQYLSKYAGTQSLKIGMLMYDNWKNEGGFMQFGALWYMKGKDSISNAECTKRMTANSVNGGYFADWFTDAPSSYKTTEGYIGLSDIGQDFAKGMGYEQISGKWVQTVKGQIGSLTVTIENVGDHAITCYGFELDNQNNLKSITYANSDDSSFSLHTRSVSYDSRTGAFVLSTDNDQDGTNNNKWTLYSYEFIQTPDSLVKLRDAYDNSLTWTGNGWKSTKDNTSQSYTTGKSLLFDDSATSSVSNNTITAQISDQVEAPLVVVNNSEKTYEITTVGNGNISISEMLLKQGSGVATLTGVATTKINVQGGSLIFLGKTDGIHLEELIVSEDTSLSVYTNNSIGEGNQATITLGPSSLARFGMEAKLNANLVLNGTTLTLSNGGLILNANLTLYGGNFLDMLLGENTILMTGVNELFLGNEQIDQLLMGEIDASNYFDNLQQGHYSLCYQNSTLSLLQIPEPSSVILSLFALTGYCLRRQRK